MFSSKAKGNPSLADAEYIRCIIFSSQDKWFLKRVGFMFFLKSRSSGFEDNGCENLISFSIFYRSNVEGVYSPTCGMIKLFYMEYFGMCSYEPYCLLRIMCKELSLRCLHASAGIEWSLDNDASNTAVLVASEAHAITLAVEGLLGVVFTVAALTDEAVDVGEVVFFFFNLFIIYFYFNLVINFSSIVIE